MRSHVYRLFSSLGPSLVGNPKRELGTRLGVEACFCGEFWTLLASMVSGVLKQTPATQCGSREVSLGSKEQLKNGRVLLLISSLTTPLGVHVGKVNATSKSKD